MNLPTGLVLLLVCHTALVCVHAHQAGDVPLADGTRVAARTNNDTGLPVFVTESHHQVFKTWLHWANTGVVPKSGVTIVHFDSHPDMGYPNMFDQSWPDDPAELERNDILDIDTFQLAGVWLGLVKRVIWVRPEWSHQLQVDYLNDTQAYLGLEPDEVLKHRVSKLVKRAIRLNKPIESIPAQKLTAAFAATIKEEYFFEDDGPRGYWRRDGFEQGRTLSEPGKVRPFFFRAVPLSKLKQTVAQLDGPVILDFDEDFFSTRNPAQEDMEVRFGKELTQQIIALMNQRHWCGLNGDPNERLDRLFDVQTTFIRMAKEKWYKSSFKAFRKRVPKLVRSTMCNTTRLRGIYNILRSLSPRDALVAISESNQAAGLPTYAQPTRSEVRSMLQVILEWIETQAQPRAVSICRSVTDGFLPYRQWAYVEWSLLHGLEDALGALDVSYDEDVHEAPAPGAVPNQMAKMYQEYFGEHVEAWHHVEFAGDESDMVNAAPQP